MSAHLAAYGRLGADPVQRTAQSGKSWATASIAVDAGSGEDAPTMWLGVVAFGQAAETLCRHAKGDMLSISGRLQLNRWTGQDGTGRERHQVVADTVISAKTVRSQSGGRREGGEPRHEQR